MFGAHTMPNFRLSIKKTIIDETVEQNKRLNGRRTVIERISPGGECQHLF